MFTSGLIRLKVAKQVGRDETRSGGALKVSGQSLESNIDEGILKNTKINVQMIAKEVQVRVGNVQNIIQNNLNSRKTGARLVPR